MNSYSQPCSRSYHCSSWSTRECVCVVITRSVLKTIDRCSDVAIAPTYHGSALKDLLHGTRNHASRVFRGIIGSLHRVGLYNGIQRSSHE